MEASAILIACITPAFLLFVGLEYWLAKQKGKENLFLYESSLANISVGIAERLLNLFITGSFYTIYTYVYEHYALYTIPNHWVVWVLLLMITDLVWYWYHRLGHEINIMWGAHIVHHQSEEFNYTVSARITTLQALIRNIFWCVLPLLGFHPNMVIVILVVHGTYSFFTHTQVIGKLGWFEKFFVTPTHHGIHHASNEKYLNKNYGDIFIFWDKLFGTFQKEEEKPTYGLTHPLKSKSFLWQHFHYYFELAEACRRSGNLRKSIKILFGKPEMLDQSLRTYIEDKILSKKKQQSKTRSFRFYLNAQILACLGGLFFFSLYFNDLSLAEQIFGASLILITLINCGALLEQEQWIYLLEVIRLMLLSATIAYETQSFGIFGVSLILILLLVSSETVERWYNIMLFNASNETNKT